MCSFSLLVFSILCMGQSGLFILKMIRTEDKKWSARPGTPKQVFWECPCLRSRITREFWFLIPSSLLCFPWVLPSFQNILCSSWILFFEFLRWEAQSHWFRKALITTKLAHQERKKAPLIPQYFYNKKYEHIQKFQFRIIKSSYKNIWKPFIAYKCIFIVVVHIPILESSCMALWQL